MLIRFLSSSVLSQSACAIWPTGKVKPNIEEDLCLLVFTCDFMASQLPLVTFTLMVRPSVAELTFSL